jgi:catechol 2,3-dioxygenase-like lactoylglutathione lyase family enzyme
MSTTLKFEHFGIDVADPVGAARWYVQHLGMKIVRQGEGPVHMHFLADSTGRVMVELYHSPPELVPDYAGQDPQVLHLALATDDLETSVARLVAAGATQVSGPSATPAGDRLAMLRDPWGLALQLTQRATPMV